MNDISNHEGQFYSLPFHLIHLLTMCLQALVIFSDNAKHNQTGRTDEFGAFRHRFVELCPIGGVAFLFFAQFHVMGMPRPSFTPDFSDQQYGEWGRRDWYSIHAFWAKERTAAMSYESEFFTYLSSHLHLYLYGI
jgi:hypothetical protein